MGDSPDDADDEIAEGSVVDEGGQLVVPPVGPAVPATDYTEGGVPTFDFVRDRIEGRFATSQGAAELAGEIPEAASAQDRFDAREQAGRDRLEQIRRAMRDDQG